MREDWTMFGACTRGSIVPPGGVTRPASGGAETTSTESDEQQGRWQQAVEGDEHDVRENFTTRILRHLSAALSRERSAYNCLVWLHVIDGRDAHARRLDDVDDLDTGAGTDVAGRRGSIRCHVGRDDDGDDAAVIGANAVVLSADTWQERRDAPQLADCTGRHRVLLRLDCVRNGSFPDRRDACRGRNATAGSGAACSDRGRHGRGGRRRVPIQRVEGSSPGRLSRALETQSG